MKLVVRLRPANDHRRVYLKLTEEGERTFNDFVGKIDACYDDIESQLSKEKLEQLHELLNQMAAIHVATMARM